MILTRVRSLRQICLVLEYEGTEYHGWQRQPELTTIQEIIENTLGRITGEKTTIMAAGRTDAGVHALGQVAAFRTGSRLTPGEFRRALNALLPQDIRIKEAAEVSFDFHPQFRALKKTYLYIILNRPSPTALIHHRCWHISRPLKVKEMREGALFLVGRHDFSSFMSSSGTTRSQIRHMTRCEIQEKGSLIELWFEADGFLKNMVRNMVGTLVDIGLGRYPPGEMEEILEAGDRRRAGPCAPPHGLYLVSIDY
jgi:tRNA pseudouridine38-40 synthase